MHRIGEKIVSAFNGEGILVQVGMDMVCLICLDTFNRWQEPVQVEKGCYEISEEEYNRIIDGFYL